MIRAGRAEGILTGFFLAIALLILMGFVTIGSLEHLLTAQQRQEESLEIRLALVRLLSLVSESESAQRGFIITGEEQFLEPYQALSRDLPEAMARLQSLLEHAPNGRREFRALEAAVRRKQERTAAMIAARRDGGFALAGREVATGAGKKAMDAIRDEIAQMDRRIAERLRIDRLESDQAGARAQRIVISASCLAVLSGIFSLDQACRGFRERSQARAEIEQANAELESRIAARTEALQKALILLEAENEERQRLEGEVLKISEREQRRIAEDLHDGHAQLLAGALHLSNGLDQRLAAQKHPEAKEAENLKQLIREALDQTRAVARGLYPVRDTPQGLVASLEELTRRTGQLFEVECILDCPKTVLLNDAFIATHLYRIAQEGINNALKHGKATKIHVKLENQDEWIDLIVDDNGSGFSGKATGEGGLGISIMKHRASLIHGELKVENRTEGGARVACRVPKARSHNENA